MDSSSKFLFALIIVAVVAGWIYMIFHPYYNEKNIMELNSNYYPSVTEESIANEK